MWGSRSWDQDKRMQVRQREPRTGCPMRRRSRGSVRFVSTDATGPAKRANRPTGDGRSFTRFPSARSRQARPNARPFPLGAGRRRADDPVLPQTLGVFVLDVIILVALARIAEPAVLHVVGLLVIAEVLGRIQATSGVQGAHLEAGLAERLDGHAAAGSRSDHDDVVDWRAHILAVSSQRSAFSKH